MKQTGMIRKMDKASRIVIPKEIRQIAQINDGDSFKVCLDSKKKSMILKKIPGDCVFCHSSKDLITYKDLRICSKCFREIGNLTKK